MENSDFPCSIYYANAIRFMLQLCNQTVRFFLLRTVEATGTSIIVVHATVRNDVVLHQLQYQLLTVRGMRCNIQTLPGATVTQPIGRIVGNQTVLSVTTAVRDRSVQLIDYFM